MTIRDQLECLVRNGVEFVVVGGQAGVMRQAVEFSHDLDILIHAVEENARRVQRAVREITTQSVDVETVLRRDFQQYFHPATGDELDVHLKLRALPDYAAGVQNASSVDYLGVQVHCLELPALYASKRTDRERDALHRQAIENRLRDLLLSGRVEPDEVVLACCLDASVARIHEVATNLEAMAGTTPQPLLQMRLAALRDPRLLAALQTNPRLHATVRAALALGESARDRLFGHRARLAALLAKVPLILPEAGHRLIWRQS